MERETVKWEYLLNQDPNLSNYEIEELPIYYKLNLNVNFKLLDELDLIITNADLQFVEHNVNEIIEGDTIAIKINVFEGQKITVDSIQIIGNSVTNESVIRSELLLDEGDPFSQVKVDKSIANLKSRRLFASVKGGDRAQVLYDRFTSEDIYNNGVTPNLMAFIPYYNNINPYGNATPNRFVAGLSISSDTSKPVSYTHLTLPTKA